MLEPLQVKAPQRPLKGGSTTKLSGSRHGKQFRPLRQLWEAVCFNSYLLHGMLFVKSTLPELRSASLAATGLPAHVESGYAQAILSFAAKALQQCPKLLMIVQPTLRRRSNRSMWVGYSVQTDVLVPYGRRSSGMSHRSFHWYNRGHQLRVV